MNAPAKTAHHAQLGGGVFAPHLFERVQQVHVVLAWFHGSDGQVRGRLPREDPGNFVPNLGTLVQLV